MPLRRQPGARDVIAAHVRQDDVRRSRPGHERSVSRTSRSLAWALLSRRCGRPYRNVQTPLPIVRETMTV
ncbi:MAG TPA: hypothetical protein VFD49_15960 [Candidatus Dormibacteraeota bacterium]|nr:hypothetical protein [Candidatus Dormibacteraeota bacterium]